MFKPQSHQKQTGRQWQSEKQQKAQRSEALSYSGTAVPLIKVNFKSEASLYWQSSGY
jgi:hypothetical protein